MFTPGDCRHTAAVRLCIGQIRLKKMLYVDGVTCPLPHSWRRPHANERNQPLSRPRFSPNIVQQRAEAQWRSCGFRCSGAESMKCRRPPLPPRESDASSPIFGYAKLTSMVISHQVLARLFCALSPTSSGGNCPPLPPLPKLRHRGGHEISLITSNHRVF